MPLTPSVWPAPPVGAGGAAAPVAPRSRTERHRNSRTKAGGIHHTPSTLAGFLAAEALRDLSEPPRRILDPACGDGRLLEAVWRALPGPAADRAELVGLDVDQTAIDSCGHRFEDVGGAHLRLHRADFVATSLDPDPASLEAPNGLVPAGSLVPADSIDLVIVNPPYVRTQTLGHHQAPELAHRYGITGRLDLYMAFAFAISRVLRPGGVMALLCSNRFLTTRAGASMRRMLLDRFSIDALFDLGDTRLFKAAVLPAVLIATRGGTTREPRFVSVYRTAETSQHRAPSFASVPALAAGSHTGSASVDGVRLAVRRGILRAEDGDAPWTLHDGGVARMSARIASATTLTIGSLTRIRVGIKTTADAVFIRDDWTELPKEIRPELALLHPLLTHHVAARWRAEPSRLRVLYPHRAAGSRTVAVDLSEYPRAAAYLTAHRVRLEAREYLRTSGRSWYEIWVPQRAHLWAMPKVVFPDIAETPRFLVDLDGRLVNGDCYWAVTRSLEEALLIAAVGNSSAARAFYDAHCANRLYAGRRRYMTQYVERFPVPNPSSPDAAAIIELARRLFLGQSPAGEVEPELDRLVSRSLGLEGFSG